MKRIVLTFGLIAGAVLSIMMAATAPFAEQIGFDRSMVVGYASMVLAFLLIYFGVRSYRDNAGWVSFGRAFGIGLLITAVASVCYVATWEIVYRTTARDFVAKYQAHALEKERSAGATETEMAERRAELERFARQYENPVYRAALTFIEPLPVGLVLALVTAGILRRPRPNDT